MTKLEKFQAAVNKAGIRGTVEKQGNSYFLRPEEDFLRWFFGNRLYWLGDSQGRVESCIEYLADTVERERYCQIGIEVWGQFDDIEDRELESWRENQEWLNWWNKAS